MINQTTSRVPLSLVLLSVVTIAAPIFTSCGTEPSHLTRPSPWSVACRHQATAICDLVDRCDDAWTPGCVDELHQLCLDGTTTADTADVETCAAGLDVISCADWTTGATPDTC